MKKNYLKIVLILLFILIIVCIFSIINKGTSNETIKNEKSSTGLEFKEVIVEFEEQDNIIKDVDSEEDTEKISSQKCDEVKEKEITTSSKENKTQKSKNKTTTSYTESKTTTTSSNVKKTESEEKKASNTKVQNETKTDATSTSKGTNTTNITETKKEDNKTGNISSNTSTETKIEETKKEETTHKHAFVVNAGWFNSNDAAEKKVDEVFSEFDSKLDNGDLSWDEYAAQGPIGYEIFRCSCGKYGLNFSYP